MLPCTLATMGDSLMKRTGWCITIIAGGPRPASEGTIMTYVHIKSISLISFLIAHLILVFKGPVWSGF